MTYVNDIPIENQWVMDSPDSTEVLESAVVETPSSPTPSGSCKRSPEIDLDPAVQRKFLEVTRSGEGRLCFRPVSGTFTERHFRNVEDALVLIEQFGHNADVWVSMATYSDPHSSRSQKNAEFLRAIWLDVDAHAGGKYLTLQDVKCAVANFLVLTALPMPTVVHFTGHGMHVLWTFTDRIHVDRWLPVAAKLQDLAVRCSLGADPITADAARILRVAGTLNFRDPATPRKCKLVGGDRQSLNFDRFTDAINQALSNAPAISKVGSIRPATVAKAIPETPENIAVVKEMLRAINPDVRYPDWRSITWAVQSTGWKAAYELARNWSERGSLWDEHAFDRVLHSFDPNGGTGFGTLVHFARQNGYTGPLPGPETNPPAIEEILAPSTCQLITACASDIEPEPVEWLVNQSIPLGAMVVIGGQPGMGKSQIAISLAASVTNGKELPDSSTFDKPGSVIILANEDDAARTIRPRLDAAGADLTKVHIVQGVSRQGGAADLFQLATDIRELRRKTQSLGDVRLIIIDPPSAYLGSKVDSYKDADVRQVLTPLGSLAQDTGALILLVVHLNKRSDAGAQQRFGGSTAWVAAPRAAFLVAEDAATRDRYMVPVKNNLGNDRTGFSYQIHERLLTYRDQTIKAPFVQWIGESHRTATELLEPPRRNSSTVVGEAQSLLEDLLSAGKMKVADVKAAADSAGISWASVQRAKQMLAVSSKRIADGWTWELIQGGDNV